MTPDMHPDRLHVSHGHVEAPPPGVVEGVSIILRGGPLDGRTGEHIGAYPVRLEMDLQAFGVWRYWRTGEWQDVTDYRPGTLELRTRPGRIYEWDGKDPDGNVIA